jgi:hypothetical protein
VNEREAHAGVEIKRVWRDLGQHTTVRMELAADGCGCLVRVHRSLNPTLFDFLVRHATVSTPMRPVHAPAART